MCRQPARPVRSGELNPRDEARQQQTPPERGCRRSGIDYCLRREERARSTRTCSVGHSNWPRPKRVSLQVMTSPIPVKSAKRSRTVASATPVSAAISESSRWPCLRRHRRMSIRGSLPFLDAIVAMNPGDDNLHLASRGDAPWLRVSSGLAESPVRYPGIEVVNTLLIAGKRRCNLAALVATAGCEGR